MFVCSLAVKRRKELNWTQEDLGRRAGISSQLISKYERGKVQPGRTNLRKLAYALTLTVAELWVEDDTISLPKLA